MNKFKKKYSKLYKYYKKELDRCQENSLSDIKNNLNYFYTYIRLLRDYAILFSKETKFLEDQKILSLCVAVEQYELYADCINNYYNISNKGVVTIKQSEKTEAEVLQEYQAERKQHWMSFWTVICENIESWENFDISI